MAQPGALLIVGIIAALGAAINQGVNFSERIAKHRKAALGHKIVVEGLKFAGLSVEHALEIRKIVFDNPEKALEVISKPSG